MIATTMESYHGSFNYASSLKAISAALSNVIEDHIFCGNVMTWFVGNVYSIAYFVIPWWDVGSHYWSLRLIPAAVDANKLFSGRCVFVWFYNWYHTCSSYPVLDPRGVPGMACGLFLTPVS